MDQRTVLVVDDEKAMRFALRRALEKEHRVIEAETGESGLAAIERESPDLVLLDLNMPGIGGLETLNRLQQRKDPPPVLILTAHGSERIAVDAMKRGAADYLPKPYDVDELRIVVRHLLAHRDLERENRTLKTALRASAGMGGLLGESAPMRKVLEVISRVAPLDVTVLIEGESGTGKELVAREMHRRSPRAAKPFVALNCAALPEGLVESELFGHERGSFTGAAATRKGRFEMAHGGSLFLDEIGEAPASLQAKLLRVLESGRFERVGGSETVEANVRLIAATNRDLKGQAAAGKFREDLYYRLKVVDVRLPPLRARASDIPLLARHFAEISATKYGLPIRAFSPRAMAGLTAYSWPGNVRELLHAAEKSVILSNGKTIDVDDLPPEIAALAPATAPEPVPAPAAAAEPASNGAPVTPLVTSGDDDDAPGASGEAAPAAAGAPLAASAEEVASRILSELPASEGGAFAELKRRANLRFETELISRELARARGNVSQTARALGLHRQSLQHKLKELALEAESFRDRAD